jgi:hypothetical protein
MSDDIANILKRLAVIESDITPVGVKKGLNKQQKSVPQLPALFKPENISPVLGSNNQKKPLGKNMFGDSVQPVRSALAERMAEIDEDMLSKVKKDLTQYLDKLEQKAKQEIQDKNQARRSRRLRRTVTRRISRAYDEWYRNDESCECSRMWSCKNYHTGRWYMFRVLGRSKPWIRNPPSRTHIAQPIRKSRRSRNGSGDVPSTSSRFAARP